MLTMLSVIIPILNEEEKITSLHAELHGILQALDRPYEIVYVDDGSTDSSFARLNALAQEHPEVVLIQSRRNF